MDEKLREGGLFGLMNFFGREIWKDEDIKEMRRKEWVEGLREREKRYKGIKGIKVIVSKRVVEVNEKKEDGK